MSIKSKLGWILLSGASLAAMGTLSPAFAQDGDDTEEIVVTATGRTAAIQDVPIAVTAIGGEQLQDAGVNTLIDLRQVTPNLRIGSGQSQTSGTSAAIRGIGTGSDNPGFEAAVGIFIDGVYRPRAGTAIGDLADVERIEILRGPQGTLFGKNTSAGAISVITAGPDFETGAWLEGQAGDLGMLFTRFGANLPVSDTMALRFDGNYRGRDGYIDDVTSGRDINDVDRWGARGQMLWDITPNASLRFIIDSGETNENCCAAVTFHDSTITAVAGGGFAFSYAMNTLADSILEPSIQSNGAGSFAPTGLTSNPEARQMTLTPNRGYREESQDFGMSGQLDWDIGGMNFTSITAFRDWDSSRDQDIDFSAMDRAYRDGLEVGVESFTQEFRLQGEAGRLNWLVGAYYGDETVTQTDRIRYGSQASAYLDALIGAFNLVPLATDQNGATTPGSGQTVFNTTTCGIASQTCALDIIFGALTATLDPAIDNCLGAGSFVGTCAALNAARNQDGPGGQVGFGEDLAASDIVDGNGQQGDHWNVQTQSIALFTHNEIALTDSLMLTLGARWTREEKDLTGDLSETGLGDQPACESIRRYADSALAASFVYQANPLHPFATTLNFLASNLPSALLLACNPAVNNIQALQNGGAYSGTYEDDAVTGTVSLSYDLNDDVMIYGGYSRGYKSGGFNIDRSGMSVLPFTELPADQSAYAIAVLNSVDLPLTFGAGDLAFDPETVDAYEIGFKSTILGGSTTLNMAAFHQQLHDYQLNAFNGFNFITRNVPEVISQGVELEMAARPTDNLTLTFGALYSDVYYDSTVAFCVVTCDAGDVITSGDPLTQAPEWTLTGSILYEVPVSDTLNARFYLNGRHLTDYRLQTLSRNPVTDQEAFAIFDARIGIGGSDGRWGLELWGRNITDEYYSVGAFAVPEQSLFSGASGQVEGVFAAFPNEPRTWGVTLRARY